MLAAYLLLPILSAPAGQKPAPVEPAEYKPPPANPADAVGDRVDTFRRPHPDTLLEPVAKEHFAAGRYAAALDAYTRWRPSHWCGNGMIALSDERVHKIALCNAHLKDHAAAARACLDVLRRERGYWKARETLVALYREAGQLADLAAMLDAAEDAEARRKHPKAWLLPAADRAKLVGHLNTGPVRELMRLADPPKWPDGLPRPKPGSLPKAPPG